MLSPYFLTWSLAALLIALTALAQPPGGFEVAMEYGLLPVAWFVLVLVTFGIGSERERTRNRVIIMLLADPSEYNAQLRLHILAVHAQDMFCGNQKLQKRSVAEIDSEPDAGLCLNRVNAARAADDAKRNFWFLHDYLVKHHGYLFPYSKITDFADNYPREQSWPISEEVRKQVRKKVSDVQATTTV